MNQERDIPFATAAVPSKPPAVVYALWCAAASVVIQASFRGWVEWPRFPSLDLLFGVLLGAVIIWSLARRRSWARWAYLVLGVIAILQTVRHVVNLPENLRVVAPVLATDLAINALDIAAIWLLFTSASARWFRSANLVGGTSAA